MGSVLKAMYLENGCRAKRAEWWRFRVAAVESSKNLKKKNRKATRERLLLPRACKMPKCRDI